ncbi:MAG: tyrosine-type recombinase/integrase [Acidimicrobiales bacterium]
MAEDSPKPDSAGACETDWRSLYLEPGDGALAEMGKGLVKELTASGLAERSARGYAGYVIRAERDLRAQGTTLLTASDEILARYALSLPGSTRSPMGHGLRHFYRLCGRSAALPLAFASPRHSAKGWPVSRRPGHAIGTAHTGHGWDGEGPAAERVRVARAYMRRKGLGPRSILHYSNRLWRAESWATERGTSLLELDADKLGDYSDALGGPSRRGLRSALRHYYAAHQVIDPPIGAVRVGPKPRMTAHPLDEAEGRRLFEVACADTGNAGDAVLLGLLLGLRREEIASLSFDDFSPDGRWLRFVGKGAVDASLPVQPLLWARIAARPRNSSSYLFPGGLKGTHVTGATIWNWVRQLGAAAGIEGMYPHKLRHTCLSIANDASGDLRGVQEFARHADPDTTAGYTRVTGARLTSIGEMILAELASAPAPVEPSLPALSFGEIVAGTLGPDAVEAWVALALALFGRAGWHFSMTAPDGLPFLEFVFSDRLFVEAGVFRGQPAKYVICQQLSDEGEDVACWEFLDPQSLVSMLGPFEAGEVLPFPPSWTAFRGKGLAAMSS